MRAALVTLLLLGAALLLWCLRDPAPDLLHDAVPAEATTTARPATAPTPVAEREKPAAAAPRVEVASAPAAPAVPELEVQVVAFGTGQPVAGAVVHHLPPDFSWGGPDWQELRMLVLTDEEKFLERVGRRMVADAEGRCRMPLPAQATRLIARAGTRFGGSMTVPGATAAQRIEVRADHALRVRLLDAAGQPIPRVVIQSLRRVEGKIVERRTLGETDAAGRIQKPHVQLLAADAGSFPVALCAHWMGADAIETTIDLAAPPAHEVELRMPAMGSVTVRAVDAAGVPLDPRYLGSRDVLLAAPDRKPMHAGEEGMAFNGKSWEARLDEHGTARFQQVGLDRYLVVKLRFGQAQGFAGPTAAAPHVETTLRESAGVVMAGRLLGPDGKVLATREFQWTCRSARDASGSNARTDAVGRFRVHLGREGAVTPEVVLTFSVPASLAGTWTRELPTRPLQKGMHELGDVRLEEPRVLIAGRLVKDPGIDAQRIPLTVERPQGLFGSQQLNPDWHDDGRFTLKGSLPDGSPLRLLVGSGAYLPVDPIACVVGGPDVEIPLRAAAEATAVFLIDEGTPWKRLQFRFRPVGGAKDDPWQRFRDLGSSGPPPLADGTLRRTWQGLAPGTYRLTVTCPGGSEPVVLVDSVALASGPCADPRLSAIDLRGRVHTLRVRATDANGTPVADRQAIVVLRGGQGDAWQGQSLEHGTAEVLTMGTVDLMVLAPGHRLAEALAVRADITVPLVRAPAAKLQVELSEPLPEGARLSLRLQPQLGPARQARIAVDGFGYQSLESLLYEHARIGPDGAATILVREAVPYVVLVAVELGGKQAGIDGAEPRLLDLDSAARGVPARIRILPGALEQALGTLRK